MISQHASSLVDASSFRKHLLGGACRLFQFHLMLLKKLGKRGAGGREERNLLSDALAINLQHYHQVVLEGFHGHHGRMIRKNIINLRHNSSKCNSSKIGAIFSEARDVARYCLPRSRACKPIIGYIVIAWKSPLAAQSGLKSLGSKVTK